MEDRSIDLNMLVAVNNVIQKGGSKKRTKKQTKKQTKKPTKLSKKLYKTEWAKNNKAKVAMYNKKYYEKKKSKKD
jgi:hypothetical protein